jgi:hypothetical protein
VVWADHLDDKEVADLLGILCQGKISATGFHSASSKTESAAT